MERSTSSFYHSAVNFYWHATNDKMFIIQCPILWYAKVCTLPSARSSSICINLRHNTSSMYMCKIKIIYELNNTRPLRPLTRILSDPKSPKRSWEEWNVPASLFPAGGRGGLDVLLCRVEALWHMSTRHEDFQNGGGSVFSPGTMETSRRDTRESSRLAPRPLGAPGEHRGKPLRW